MHDETNFFPISEGQETWFLTPTTTDFEMMNSSENKWPTLERPNDRYKYFSVELYLDTNIVQINRKTTSTLDWIGDLGGLLDGINYIMKILISPYSIYVLESKLAWLLLRLIP